MILTFNPLNVFGVNRLTSPSLDKKFDTGGEVFALILALLCRPKIILPFWSNFITWNNLLKLFSELASVLSLFHLISLGCLSKHTN